MRWSSKRVETTDCYDQPSIERSSWSSAMGDKRRAAADLGGPDSGREIKMKDFP
jgi:hypothetical protein